MEEVCYFQYQKKKSLKGNEAQNVNKSSREKLLSMNAAILFIQVVAFKK